MCDLTTARGNRPFKTALFKSQSETTIQRIDKHVDVISTTEVLLS